MGAGDVSGQTSESKRESTRVNESEGVDKNATSTISRLPDVDRPLETRCCPCCCCCCGQDTSVAAAMGCVGVGCGGGVVPSAEGGLVGSKESTGDRKKGYHQLKEEM